MNNLIERLRKPVAYGPVGAQAEREESATEIERLNAVIDRHVTRLQLEQERTETLTAEGARKDEVIQAARWVVMNVVGERIPGLVQRTHFKCLSNALEAYDAASGNQDTTNDRGSDQYANPADSSQPTPEQVWLYNQGYLSGHHDTVEGMFTDVLADDIETYHDDVVADMLRDRDDSRPTPKCTKVVAISAGIPRLCEKAVDHEGECTTADQRRERDNG